MMSLEIEFFKLEEDSTILLYLIVMMMTKFNEKTLSKLKTADKLFDEKYGKKGTKSREEFEIKSRAWYMKAIKTKN